MTLTMGTHSVLSTSGHADSAIEIAGKTVDGFLKNDSCAPHLVDLLRIAPSACPSVSGLQDIDYPILRTTGVSRESLNREGVIKRVPLPGELVEQFGHLQCNCMMGLFPEIGRAWLTIDSDIFIWTYDNGGDLAYFNGLNETILSVSLLKPKQNIFKEHIHFLLCLTTPVEIILLGVTFSVADESGPINYLKSEMHLLPEPLFFLPSDNNHFLTIVGTKHGRVFMGSKNGCLFEFVYQAEDGWFSRKCRKVNHSWSSLSYFVPNIFSFAFSEEDPIVQIAADDSRNILYTRSEKGTLQVFDLGEDGKLTSRIASYSRHAIVRKACEVVKTLDRSNFKPIVHIAAMGVRESLHLHLVAITQSGVRLYFTTTSLSQPLSRPFSLELVHVRLPPGFAANAPPQCPTKVHMAHYQQGALVLVSSQTEDNDAVWMISNDKFPFHSQLMETQNILNMEGKVWALAETSSEVPFHRQILDNQVNPPLVVTQHVDIPRQFVFLTPQGCYIATHLRLVDQLRLLLNENQGPDCEVVKAFFALHKEDMACATCLILACSQRTQDKQVSEWAARAFFLFGGEPSVRYPTALGMQSPQIGPATNVSFTTPTRFLPQHVSTPNQPQVGGFATSPGLNMSQQMRPGSSSYMYQQQSDMAAQSPTPRYMGPEICFSGKHNGLYIYLSRILRPVWDCPIVQGTVQATLNGYLSMYVSTVTGEELTFLQNHVSALKDFLETFAQDKTTSSADRIGQNLPQRVRNFLRPDSLSSGDMGQMQQQLQKNSQAEAQLQEKLSLINLQQLIARISETLCLWKILVDHDINVILCSASKDIQSQLLAISFRDFVISGKEMANNLVSALINHYLADNATTDAISNRLRVACPSIYKTEHAVSAKTIEILLSARKCQNVQEREKLLRDALQLAKQIPLQLNVPIICSYFQAVHCYSAVVDLCLTAAAQKDPQGIALQYYRNGEPHEDQQGFQAYMDRTEFYKVILNAFDQLTNISMSHPHSPSIPKTPGPPEQLDPSMMSPTEAANHWEKTFNLILKSDDELMHVALYKWLRDKRLVDKLMEVRSVSLENYLKRSSTSNPDNSETLDLLWKFYEKSGNYSAAARVLVKLAERQGEDVNLQRRIEYLSRAAMCIKSSEVRISLSSEGEFLQDLEEKLEVARIQLMVLDALNSLPQNQQTWDAISKLNSDLLNISELYQKFAEPFNLHECKLAIVHCANHYDPPLIESLWKNILDKEFTILSGSSSDNIVATICNKMKSLGTKYFSSQKYFPLAYLIKYLEQESAKRDLNYSWVFKLMHSIGSPYSQMLDIYSKLYKLKDPFWPAIRKPLHLLHVLCSFFGTYADSLQTASIIERRQVKTLCIDYIASFMVDLQALGPASNHDVVVLMESFSAAQAKLERIS